MTSLNPFQAIALTIILFLLIYELYIAVKGRALRSVWALRTLAWIAAGIAIYQPEQITRIALAVGIQRGADLVLYLVTLAFLATSLYLYARCLRLQQQITQVVRHIAITEAHDPTSAPQD